MQGPYNCYPLPPSRVGGDTEREVKGEDCQGVGGRVGGGKVKGQLSLRPVGTSVVRERMNKAPAVQSGRPLPVGRRASPPWAGPTRYKPSDTAAPPGGGGQRSDGTPSY